MCVIALKSIKTGNTWREIGRTECIKNCKDPDFTTTVTLDYFFEEVQELQLTVSPASSDPQTHRSTDIAAVCTHMCIHLHG